MFKFYQPKIKQEHIKGIFSLLILFLLFGLFGQPVFRFITVTLNQWELDSLTFRQLLYSSQYERSAAETSVVLVGIDHKTSSSKAIEDLFGRFWSRAIHGHAIRFFKRTTPKSVFFDLSFNGGTFQEKPAGDRFMVDSLQDSGVFSSALMFSVHQKKPLEFSSHSAQVQNALRRHAVQIQGLENIPFLARQNYTTLNPPFPELLLQSNMKFFSATASALDERNLIRYFIPISNYGGYVFPSYSLAVASNQAKEYTLDKDGLLSWEGGKLNLGDGKPLIKWYKNQLQEPLYPEYSYVDIVLSELALSCQENAQPSYCQHPSVPDQPILNPELFKDKHVVIGITVENDGDVHSTIFNSINKKKYPGVYVVANQIDNVLRNDFVLSAPAWLNWGIYLVFVGFAFYFISRFKADWKVALSTAIALIAGIMLLAIAAYNYQNLWINTMKPMVSIVLLYTGGYIYWYIKTEKTRQQLRHAFGKYVAPGVMATIEKNPDALKLGGQKKELTMMFSDIRGFTTFSENNDPQVVQTFLTQYFSAMHGIIMHKYQGSINKLIGDAIMAYWGFPLETKDHALQAVFAALEMKKALEEWNANPENIPVNIGIGINTGDVVIGNVGSEDFMDFTVIGDAVNLASRLEGLNKEYGTNIIISAATYALVKDQIEARPLGKAKVKGKETEIEIYEPTGLKNFAS